MPVRTVEIGGHVWEVSPSGRVTPNDRDEFSLVFARRDVSPAEIRVTRYSPIGARWREQSRAELGPDDLARLFAQSQPGIMSPERGYRAGAIRVAIPARSPSDSWISTCIRPRPTAPLPQLMSSPPRTRRDSAPSP